MSQRSKFLNYALISSAFVLLNSCVHKGGGSDVTPANNSGCMDMHATNYNPTAIVSTTCNYKIQTVLGKYRVTDSFFRAIKTSDTTMGYDTTVSTDDVTVSFINWRIIKFDKVVLCGDCDSASGIHINPDNLIFSYTSINYMYNYISGGGNFSGDTITFHTGNRNSLGSIDRHSGRGIRIL